MTKSELAEQVSLKTGVDPKTVMDVFEQSLDTIKSTVATGEGCYFRGFGTFSPKKRARKVGRNIKKGVSVIVPEHNIAFFKPGKEFSDSVRKLKV